VQVQKARRIFSSPVPYLGWLGLSAALLAVAWVFDPYVFGFAVLGALGISGGLFVLALFFGRRPVLLAALAGLPAVIAFAVLSRFHWT